MSHVAGEPWVDDPAMEQIDQVIYAEDWQTDICLYGGCVWLQVGTFEDDAPDVRAVIYQLAASGNDLRFYLVDIHLDAIIAITEYGAAEGRALF
jgi:hypothetical protein